MTTRPHVRVGATDAEAPGIPLSRLAGSVVLLTATATTVAGTFLPWLDSGRVTRNSYQLTGTLDRFRLIDSTLLDAALAVWPFLAPAGVAAFVLLVFRLWRTAGSVAALVGVIAVVGAVTAQVKVGDRAAFGVSLNSIGPATVIIGGVLLVLAGALLWLPSRHAVRLSVRS